MGIDCVVCRVSGMRGVVCVVSCVGQSVSSQGVSMQGVSMQGVSMQVVSVCV